MLAFGLGVQVAANLQLNMRVASIMSIMSISISISISQHQHQHEHQRLRQCCKLLSCHPAGPGVWTIRDAAEHDHWLPFVDLVAQMR